MLNPETSSEQPNPQPLTPKDFPLKGVLLGIDYGTRRVGVAVSDMYQRYSSPLHNYQSQSKQADERFFRKLQQEFRPVGIVVGLPIHLSGDESEKSREARSYAKKLSKLLGLPVAFQDERFSSSFAETILMQSDLSKQKRKDRIDKLAAQILLQAFLDGRASSASNMQEADAADPNTESP